MFTSEVFTISLALQFTLQVILFLNMKYIQGVSTSKTTNTKTQVPQMKLDVTKNSLEGEKKNT